MYISIVARVIAVALVCALAPQLGLADTVYTYNFNNLTGGTTDPFVELNGQDGWVSTTGMKARGTTGVDVWAGTRAYGTGARTATAYRNSSGNASWPFKNSVTSFSLVWYAVTGASRISRVGLSNASGVPFFVVGGDLTNWKFTSYANTITTSGTIPSGYNYYDCRIDVDLVAGTASFSKRTHLSGSFAAVSGMQNMLMELPVGFAAGDLKSLFLRSLDQGSIDDIVITYVVASPAGTVITIR